MNKPKKFNKLVQGLSNYLESVLDAKIVDKTDLFNKISKSKISSFVFGDMFSSKDFKKFTEDFTDDQFFKLISMANDKLTRKISKKSREQEKLNQLLKIISNDKILKNYNVTVVEFVEERRDHYVAKVCLVCGTGFIEGTVKEIVKNIKEIIKDMEIDAQVHCSECSDKKLRFFESKQGRVCLCYNCGSLFLINENRVLIKYPSEDKNSWDARAIADINTIASLKYGSEDFEDRKKELLRYLRVHTHTAFNDDDILEICNECKDCGCEIYTYDQFYQLVMDEPGPEETLLELGKIINDHQVTDFLKQDYEEIDYGDKVVRVEGKPFFLSPEITQFIVKQIVKIYRDWVNNDFIYDVSHEEDPPWDCSGRLVEFNLTKLDKIKMFPTLEKWMENAYTGESYPSFESGCGMTHETYNEVVLNLISDELWRIWTKKLTDKERDKLYEEINEDGSLERTYDFESNIFDLVGKMSIIEAYKLGE